MLQDNLAQQERLTVLRQDITTKLAELKNPIALRQTQGFNAALTVVNTDLGKADMNAIRAQISSIRQAEEALREQRIAEMTHAQDRALSSNIIAALVGLLLTLAVGLLIRQASLTRKRQEWFQSGEVGLEAVMRGEQRAAELGENILGFMAHHLGAIAGAMYVNEGDSFHRVATYGAPAGAAIPEQFRPKEGLLGQAAAENRQLSINDVPDGYLAFGSALGQGKPTQLLILPSAVDAAIASVVRSAKYRDELRALLAEMQHKSEELQVQGEELRVSNEELEEQSRALKESQARLQQQQSELNQSNAQLEEQTKYAQTIQYSGNDLLTLINDILDLSKIEACHVTIRPETVPLERLTENLHQLFLPVSQEKQLGFVITTAPDLQRLEQVLKNLLSNAFKFTERGEVRLEIKPAASNRIAFAVTDTGIGISPDQQAQIFSAFHQADSTISRKYGGTGLELSISRELARLLGGSIQVQSQPDNGSVFTVIIPESYDPKLVAPREAETPVALPLPSPLPKAKLPPRPLPQDDRANLDLSRRALLLVEDDENFADILRGLSREMGFQTLLAATAEEALQLAHDFMPSAIILDVGLPDQSGLAVLDRLKRNVRTRHITHPCRLRRGPYANRPLAGCRWL